MDPLSLEDLFLVGVTFDLLGAYFLARGLLYDPGEGSLASKPAEPTRGSVAAERIRTDLDTRVGIYVLAIGFVFQAAGYVLTLIGVKVTTDTVRTLVALALAALALLLAFWIADRFISWGRTAWAKSVIKSLAYVDGMSAEDVIGTTTELVLELDVGKARESELFDTGVETAELVERSMKRGTKHAPFCAPTERRLGSVLWRPHAGDGANGTSGVMARLLTRSAQTGEISKYVGKPT